MLELPTQDLLLSQRVCKTWRTLISTMPRLQRALFMLPATCGSVCYLDWRHDDKGFYANGGSDLDLGEPLRDPNGNRAMIPYRAHWGRTRGDSGRYRVFFNPLLAKLFPFVAGKGIYTLALAANLPEAALRMCASWRRMLVTQPPIRLMVIESDDEDIESTGTWKSASFASNGVLAGFTMGELMGLLVHRIACPAWIEGRDLWEEWSGVDDLKRIVVGVGEIDQRR